MTNSNNQNSNMQSNASSQNQSYSKVLVPEAKAGLNQLKNEIANELNVKFSDYNGNLSSKECGSVGGEMVKKMVAQYEQNLK